MATGYLIATATISDPERFTPRRESTGPVIAQGLGPA